MASFINKSSVMAEVLNLFVTSTDENCNSKWLKFWACEETIYDEVSQLMDEIQENLKNDRNIPCIDGLKIKDYCCAKFEDDRWYRALITSKLNDEISVFFIDYGNSERVTLNNVRKANSVFFELPSMIKEYVICDIDCLMGNWSKSAIELFTNKILYDSIKVTLVSLNQNLVANVMLSDDTYLFDYLVENGLAIKKGAIDFKNESPSIKDEDFHISKDYSVYISHVETLQKFWIQLADKENDLNVLMSEMDTYYNSNSNSIQPNIKKGEFCATMYSEDECFYRAVITELNSDSCDILFIDYGNSENKKNCDLKLLPDNFRKLPAQAVRCALAGVSSDRNVISVFISVTENKLLNASVLRKLSDCTYEIELSDEGFSTVSLLGNSSCAVLQKNISSLSAMKYAKSLLQIGLSEHVTISYLVNANNFCVQCLKDICVLEELMVQLEQKYKTSDIPVLEESSCLIGMACCTNFSVDNEWYRAEIISLPGNGEIEVHYVDYGNTEITNISNVKLLLDEFINIPSLAINCYLLGLEDLTWNTDAYNKFEQLTYENKLLAKVLKSLDNKFGIELFDEHNLNINNELRHILSSKEFQRKDIVNNFSPSVKEIKTSLPVVNSIETIHVSFFESPNNFYGQLARFSIDALESFQIDLNRFYNSLEVKTTLFSDGLTPLNDSCCIKYSEDQLWYRGKIIEVSGNNALIHFIDFGNYENKPLNSVYKLDPKFCVLPQQGIQCYFIDMVNDVSKLKELLLENSVEVEIVENKENKYGVTITSNPINTALRKFFTILNNKNPCSHSIYLTYPKPAIKNGDQVKVVVTHINSLNQFWCQLQANNKELDKIMDKIDEYCNDPLSNTSKIFVPGECCLAKYSIDSNWYRAIIQKFHSSNDAEIFFIDYGNSEVVLISNIKEIKEEYLVLPFQCLECRLIGSKNISMSVEELNNLLLGNEFIIFVANVIGLIYEVEVLEKQTLNKVFENLSHLNNNWNKETFTTAKSKKKSNRGDDSDNSSCSSDSVFQQYIPHRSHNQDYFLNKTSPKMSDFSNKRTDNSHSGLSTKEKNCYSFFNVTLNTYEDIAAVHIIDPYDFCCQFLRFSDQLQKLMESLNVFYEGLKESDYVIENTKVGGPCVAIYSEDDMWYRAEIISLQEDAVEVLFVDYGNREITSLSKIKSLKSEFFLLPVQAIHCSLFNIKPINEKWSCENIDSFKSLILDVPLVGHIKERKSDGKYYVDLIDYRVLQNVFVSYELIQANQAQLVDEKLTVHPLHPFSQKYSKKNILNIVKDSTIKKVSSPYEQERSTSAQFSPVCSKYSKPLSHSAQLGIKTSPLPILDLSLNLQKIKNYAVKEIHNGQKYPVKLSWIINPSEFFCQLTEDQEALEQLLNGIEDFYNNLEEDEFLISDFEINMPCVAPFTENNSWNRAQVKDINDGMIDVISIDFGFCEQLTSSRVKQAHADFMDLPSQAIKCCIRSVKPVGPEWPTLPQTRLLELFGSEGYATFYACFNGVYIIDLQTGEKNVADELIAAGIAKPVKSSSTSSSSSASSQLIVSINRSSPLTSLEIESCVKIGDYEDVVVSYVKSPQSFWCQLMKYMPLLEELMEQINNSVNTLLEKHNSLSEIVIGSSCIAKYSKNEKWHRAIIKENLVTNIRVHFIDYGYMEDVSLNNIKVLLPEFAKLPQQAIECCLYNIPYSSPQMIEKLQKSVESKEDCVIKIIEMTKSQIKVQLYDESETDINQMLLNISEGILDCDDNQNSLNNSEIIQSTSREEFNGETKEIWRNGQFILPDFVKLSPGKQMVHVCYFESPNKFFIQSSELIQSIQRLADNINQFYHKNSPEALPSSDIIVNRLCLSRFSLDSQFYRAVVVSLESNSSAILRFIDYGNSEAKSFSEIYELPHSFLLLSPMAILCQLITFKDDSDWSEEMNILFKKTVEGKYFLIDILDTKLPVVVNFLEDSSGCPFLLSSGNNETACDVATKDNFCHFYPRSISSCENPVIALVTDACSPLKFYLQIRSEQDRLFTLYRTLQDKASSSSETFEKLTVNQPCAALFLVDNCWYRGLILNVFEDCASIKFVDFGNTENIELSNLKPLNSEFLLDPPLALECCLEGIPQDINLLPDEWFGIFSQLVLGKEICVFFSDPKSKAPYSVKLRDGDKDICQYLLANVHAPESSNSVISKPFDISLMSDDSVIEGNDISEENYKIIDIKNGSREEAIVSCFKSPGKFWIQLCRSQEEVISMMNSLSDFYDKLSEDDMILTSFEINKPCVALFTLDNNWYRAKICNFSGDLITVQYVDYGKTVGISRKYIKEIKSDFLKIPMLSLECKLKNILPVENIWDRKCISFVEEFTGYGRKLMLEFTKSENSYAVQLLHNDIQIDDVLVKNGWAIYVNNKVISDESCEDQMGCSDIVKMINDELASQFSHVSSHDHHFCDEAYNLPTQNLKPQLFANATNEIQESALNSIDITSNQGYDKQTDTKCDLVNKSEVGLSSLEEENVSSNGEFATESKNVCSDTISVMDFKNAFDINTHSEISIVKNSHGENKIQEENELLKEMSPFENLLKALCQSNINQELDSLASSPNTDILNKEGRIEDTIERTILCKEENNANLETGVKSNILDCVEDKASQCIDAEKHTLSKEYSEVSEEGDYEKIALIQEYKLKEDSPNEECDSEKNVSDERCELEGNMCNSVDCILEENKEFKSFTSILNNESYIGEESIVCKCETEKKILSTENIYLCEEYEIEKDDNVKHCVLETVVTNSENDSELKKLESEKILNEEDDTNEVSNLNKTNSPNINKECKLETPPHLKANEETESDSLENFDFHSGVGDFVKDCDFTANNSENYALDIGAGDYKPNISKETTNPNVDVLNNSLISDLMINNQISCQCTFSLPDLLIDSHIEVLVLEANNPSSFWCQLASSSNNLPTLMDALQDYYCQLNDTEDMLDLYEVGLSCVAPFDNGWYRAVISQVFSDDVEVLFVDYGSSEKLSFSKIKKMYPEFLNLPVQAFQCELYNVSPPGQNWDIDSSTRFEEMTYRKTITAEIINVTHSDKILSLKIHVRLFENNIDVAKTLIDAGYAIESG